jgi:hypothetical protein
MPSLLPEEIFEDGYTAKFKDRFRSSGLVIEYARDRAATDLGIQFTVAPGSLVLSGVRVWFQLKGQHEGKYSEVL